MYGAFLEKLCVWMNLVPLFHQALIQINLLIPQLWISSKVIHCIESTDLLYQYLKESTVVALYMYMNQTLPYDNYHIPVYIKRIFTCFEISSNDRFFDCIFFAKLNTHQSIHFYYMYIIAFTLGLFPHTSAAV